jgi:hypothetical protein
MAIRKIIKELSANKTQMEVNKILAEIVITDNADIPNKIDVKIFHIIFLGK